MGMKHALAIVGLSAALLSGAAQASTLYDVNFGFGGGQSNGGPVGTYQAFVSGTLTTDGTLGPLQASDITGYNLVATLTNNGMTSSANLDSSDPNAILNITGTDLSAVLSGSKNYLVFAFSGDDGEFSIYAANGGFDFYAGNGTSQYPGYLDISVNDSDKYVNPPGDLVIGTAVSSVPLPASAPMFGAALLALGAVGYGMKRRKAAAAA